MEVEADRKKTPSITDEAYEFLAKKMKQVSGVGEPTTLRDFLAASALGGLLANPSYYDSRSRSHTAHKDVAETAYRIADEMLASR